MTSDDLKTLTVEEVAEALGVRPEAVTLVPASPQQGLRERAHKRCVGN